MMTAQEFDLAADVARISGRTREALRVAYVDGITIYAAARNAGIARQVLYRARPRIERAQKLLRDAVDATAPQRFQ
jgi:hypothetical protein